MLVIEWDRDRLIVLSGDASGKAVTVRAAATVERVDGQTPEELGAQLRQALSANGISEESATVVLPRQQVTLRRIQLPNVGDDELPAMVRLQAATRLTVPIESVALDFVPLPGATGEGRDVLLVTAPGTYVAGVRKAFTVAGLELSGVRVSSFAIAQALAHAGHNHASTGSSNAAAIMCLRADMIEFLVMMNQSLAFSHSGAGWDGPEKIEQAARQEISRGRLAATEDLGTHTITQLTLVGDPETTSAVPDDVAKRLNNATVTRLNPAGDLIQGNIPDDLTASELLAAAGIIAGTKRQLIESVDLVNPRKPPVKADNTRMKVILAAGLGALVLVGGWKWRDSRIQEYDSTASVADTEAGKLKAKYKEAEQELAQDKSLQEWSLGDVNWIDEMVRIREIMGSTENLLIRDIDFLTTANSKHRGKITADCYAKSRQDAQDFMRRLTAEGYDVAPGRFQTGSSEPDYPVQVSLELNIPLPEENS